MNTSPDVLFFTDDEAAFTQIAELSTLGFQVRRVQSLTELYSHVSKHSSQLVILACPLSVGDIAAAQLRVMHPSIGIVALAHFASSDARIRTLLSGADACLATETSGLELAAVCQTLLRRVVDSSPVHAPLPASVPISAEESDARLRSSDTPNTTSGAWQLTSKGWALTAPTGQTLSLTTAERSLVLKFAQAPEKRLSREALSLAMAPSGDQDDSERRGRFVDVMISRMRRKATAQRLRLPIKAVHGWGYMFTADLLVDPDTPELEDLTVSATA
jgi:two-component system OmpR family response regulator